MVNDVIPMVTAKMS